MTQNRSRYKEMERYMTYALLADAGLFVLYLIFAACGVVWLKVILALFAIILSGLCLGFLYITKELLRKRSRWMSAAAAAVLVCVLFSLILNFPRPNKYKKEKAPEKDASVIVLTEDLY